VLTGEFGIPARFEEFDGAILVTETPWTAPLEFGSMSFGTESSVEISRTAVGVLPMRPLRAYDGALGEPPVRCSSGETTRVVSASVSREESPSRDNAGSVARDPGLIIGGAVRQYFYSVFRKAIRSCFSSGASFNPNSCPLMGPGPRWKPCGT
jgi:hypothetical protein